VIFSCLATATVTDGVMAATIPSRTEFRKDRRALRRRPLRKGGDSA